MIYLYSGTPGSGKSLHAAERIAAWSRLGSPVICNFECNLEKFKRAKFTYLSNSKLTPKALIQISRDHFKGKTIKEGSLLLIVDEAQILFNAREWNKPGQKEWIEFFTQHRKYGYDIILIAQFDRMLDRQIRSLLEYEYIHRKMSCFGIQGKLMSLFFGGSTIMCVKYWYPIKEKISSELLHARKRHFQIYDTYNTFKSDTGAAADPGLGVPGAAVPVAALEVLKEKEIESEEKEHNNIA